MTTSDQDFAALKARVDELDKRVSVIEEWENEPMSPKQWDFILDLAGRADPIMKQFIAENEQEIVALTKKKASELIDALMAREKEMKQ